MDSACLQDYTPGHLLPADYMGIPWASSALDFVHCKPHPTPTYSDLSYPSKFCWASPPPGSLPGPVAAMAIHAHCPGPHSHDEVMPEDLISYMGPLTSLLVLLKTCGLPEGGRKPGGRGPACGPSAHPSAGKEQEHLGEMFGK